MAEVVPFKGVLYNIPSVSGLSGRDVVAPPYDIITPDYREELYKKSPYNIVRVDFGKELPGDDEATNKYTRARAFLEAWLREGVLVAGRSRSFYSYEISYTIESKAKKLSGFLGLVRLEELGKGSIHPHECTHSKPKRDRLEVMRACNGNISPIFSLYSSKERKASSVVAASTKERPSLEALDPNGCLHRLWQITDRNSIDAVQDEMRNRPVFIADGHHRYETALEFQNEMRDKGISAAGERPSDYVLMFLANMQDEGLTILPTHRLVKEVPGGFLESLSSFFEIQEIERIDVRQALSGGGHVLALYLGGRLYRLRYRGGDLSTIDGVLASLDVTILHELIFGRLLKPGEIEYDMDIEKCLAVVNEGRFGAAFFLNPTRVEDVERVALASLRMPPKSTFFYPKLMTGMVLNIFNKSF